MANLRTILCVTILVLWGCKKPYNPPASSSPNSFLVVEGVINSGEDSTVIKISKTVKLTDTVTTNSVLGANVTVEGEQGGIYPLYDINNNGHYNSITGLNLSTSQKYRLKIVINGGQYLSDLVEIKPTPPIDSIGYSLKSGNIHLYVNAHDPNNTTRYYRWDYDETWIFHAKYGSFFVLDPASNSINPRTANQQVYYCFGNDVSHHIILTSTEKLANDVVYQNILTQIPLTDEKLERRYSIMLRQYALTRDAYSFYERLEKNTENLGSIFDAQPSQLSGNIHSVSNPAEIVIGFITATNIQSKRIYVSHQELPGDVQPIYPFDCTQDTALYNDALGTNQVQNTLINPPVDYIPTSGLISKNGVIIGYLYSTVRCTDCTLRGTIQPPAWWH